MGAAEDLSMAEVKLLEHISSAALGEGTGCQERNQRSRNRVLGTRMLLLQVLCTLGTELVEWTGQRCQRLSTDGLMETALTLSRARSAMSHIFATVDSEYKEPSASLIVGLNSKGGVTSPNSPLVRGSWFGSRMISFSTVSQERNSQRI